MKKPLILLLALCLLLGYLPARADTARDVGAECALAYQDNSLACGYLVDHNYVRGDNLASKVEHIFYVTPGKNARGADRGVLWHATCCPIAWSGRMARAGRLWRA